MSRHPHGRPITLASRARRSLRRRLGVPVLVHPAVPGMPDGTDIFCGADPAGGESGRPIVLKESRHGRFRMIASPYPLGTGHVLIVPNEHVPTFADVPLAWHAELEELVREGERFQNEMYPGTRTFIREQGSPVERQAVHHAHLHLIPVHLPVELPPAAEFTRVRSWFDVGRYRLRQGDYHYVQLGHDRWVMPDVGPEVAAAERMLSEALLSIWDPEKLQPTKHMGPEARVMLDDVLGRWAEWSGRQAGGASVAA
jgi:diadenosine tetraphosphate (Ap4A) HIT family hydrolase